MIDLKYNKNLTKLTKKRKNKEIQDYSPHLISVSLSSILISNSSSVFFSFCNIGVFEEYRPVIYRLFLNSVLSDASSWLYSGGYNTTRAALCLSQDITGRAT